MHGDVVQTRANFKRFYLWSFKNPACGDFIGSNGIVKDQVHVPHGLVWGKGGEKGWYDLVCVCVEHLYIFR